MVRRLKSDLRAIGEKFLKRNVGRIMIDRLPDDAPELVLSRLLQRYRKAHEVGRATAIKSQQESAMLVVMSLQKCLLSSIEVLVRTLAVQRASMLGPANKTPGVYILNFDLLATIPDTDDERAEYDEWNTHRTARARHRARRRHADGRCCHQTQAEPLALGPELALLGAAVSLYPLRGTPSNLHTATSSPRAARDIAPEHSVISRRCRGPCISGRAGAGTASRYRAARDIASEYSLMHGGRGHRRAGSRWESAEPLAAKPRQLLDLHAAAELDASRRGSGPLPHLLHRAARSRVALDAVERDAGSFLRSTASRLMTARRTPQLAPSSASAWTWSHRRPAHRPLDTGRSQPVDGSALDAAARPPDLPALGPASHRRTGRWPLLPAGGRCASAPAARPGSHEGVWGGSPAAGVNRANGRRWPGCRRPAAPASPEVDLEDAAALHAARLRARVSLRTAPRSTPLGPPDTAPPRRDPAVGQSGKSGSCRGVGKVRQGGAPSIAHPDAPEGGFPPVRWAGTALAGERHRPTTALPPSRDRGDPCDDPDCIASGALHSAPIGNNRNALFSKLLSVSILPRAVLRKILGPVAKQLD